MRSILSPIEEPFSKEIADILSHYPSPDGNILKLFRVFANSRRFLNKGVLNLLDRASPLNLRERELVILRVCVNNDCEYEWGVHVAGFAKPAGFSASEIVDICQPSLGELWKQEDRDLLDIVDELCGSGRVEKKLKVLQESWSLEQQLEIFALVGNYHTIAFVANTAQLAPETYAARFPAIV